MAIPIFLYDIKISVSYIGMWTLIESIDMQVFTLKAPLTHYTIRIN